MMLRRDTLRPLLTSRAFLAAVAILVINDRLLKPALGNWLTGKLSDVAGVFALPLLWSAFFPSRRKAGFVLTALGFALWKSPVFDAPLMAWNSVGIWRLTRVVDFTDWIALLALLPAYGLVERYAKTAPCKSHATRRPACALVSGFVAIVVLVADSVAQPRYALPDTTSYTILASRDEIRTGLGVLGFDPKEATIGEERGRVADTLSFYIRQPPERPVDITVEVKEFLPAEVRLRLLTAHAFGPEPSTASLERALEKQVIEPLKDWSAKHRNRP